jgi:hypothetical protein
MTEPTYEYIRGTGWVPSFDSVYEVVDQRVDKEHDGRFYVQVYLVGIDGFGYRDWVDNWGYDHRTLEDAFQKIKSWRKESADHVTRLLTMGMKIRVVHRD